MESQTNDYSTLLFTTPEVESDHLLQSSVNSEIIIFDESVKLMVGSISRLKTPREHNLWSLNL